MIRFCSGEVFSVDISEYNESAVLDFFRGGNEDKLVQIIDSKSHYLGLLSYDKDRDLKGDNSGLVLYNESVTFGYQMFGNIRNLISKNSSRKYYPVLDKEGFLSLFAYFDASAYCIKTLEKLQTMNQMKCPEMLFSDYDVVNIYGFNEAAFYLYIALKNRPAVHINLIGEGWKLLGEDTCEKDDLNIDCDCFEFLAEGNYGLDFSEMGMWAFDSFQTQDRYIYDGLIRKIESNRFSAAMYGRKLPSYADSQDILYRAIQSGKPFMAARLGNTEAYITSEAIDGAFSNTWLNWLYSTSGFFSEKNEVSINDVIQFAQMEIEAISNTDIEFAWFPRYVYFLDKVAKPDVTIVPWLTLVSDEMNSCRWVKALEGKKVLVISAFPETVSMQYEKRDDLASKEMCLPTFEELFVYKMVQTQAGNNEGFNNFFEAYNHVLSDISKIDFDVALISAGAYGYILASAIKNMGKQAIEACSLLMPIFGIKNKRSSIWPEINKYYNSSWSFPIDAKMKNYQVVENGAYWG